MMTKFRDHAEPTGKSWWEKLREKGVFDFKFVLRVIGIAYFLIGIAYFLWVNYFSLSEW